MVKTTQIVAKTHQKEKLEYLANALINSADVDFDEELTQIFLELVERYTLTHIKLLNLYYQTMNGSRKIQSDLINGYFRDDSSLNIYTNQLFIDGMLGYTNDAEDKTVIMPLGEKFLKFITINGGVNDEK